MGPAVTISDLTFHFFEDSPPVFSRYGLSIPAGTCCAILGPTGAGKTTLVQILSGIAGSQFKTAAAQGTVEIGANLYEPIPRHVLFPEAGLVLQDSAIQISGIKDTVRSELEFTIENLSVPRADRQIQVDRILSQLRLEPFAGRNPSQLSGGELRRVVIGSMLIASPPLLLLDEPANALDGDSRHELKLLLRSLTPSSTVVLTDYSIDFALGLADLFVVLDNGSNAFIGTQHEFLDSLPRFQHLLPLESWHDLHQAGFFSPAEGRSS